jgi:SAM-dependent methyltransferase
MWPSKKPKAGLPRIAGPAKNEYFQSDIFTYVPTQHYDVILFGDSIYYLNDRRITEMLDPYSRYLKPDGVFIVRTWTLKDRHRAIVQNLQGDFDVVEKHLYHELQMVVLAFRPPARGRAAWRDHS